MKIDNLSKAQALVSKRAESLATLNRMIRCPAGVVTTIGFDGSYLPVPNGPESATLAHIARAAYEADIRRIEAELKQLGVEVS